jgi:hypothetical protein
MDRYYSVIGLVGQLCAHDGLPQLVNNSAIAQSRRFDILAFP